MPLGLTLLHALRLEADPNADASATWLSINGLNGGSATVRALAEMLGHHMAPPGKPVLWPHEQALLEALARVDREPDQAENLLAFLPPATRAAGMALLTDLSRCISAELVNRLKHPSRNPGHPPLSARGSRPTDRP